MMINKQRVLSIVLTWAVLVASCGQGGSNAGGGTGGAGAPGAGGTPGAQNPAAPQVIIKNTPNTQAAYYQFNAHVGTKPNQTPFDPSYRPKSRAFKSPSRTREGSGALLYTEAKGETYVLLGKERSNKTWNYMRGSVDAGKSYVEAAANEIHEETAGIYQVTEDVLLTESYDVYIGSAKNHGCTFFVKVDYVPASVLVHSAQTHPDGHFREMTDYKWIRLADLNAALGSNSVNFSAQDIDGSTDSYQFYLYSFNSLRHAHQLGILTHLN